jgi:hypothetical protein
MEFNGQKIKYDSIRLDGILNWSTGHLADAFIVYAEYENGAPLTEDELDELGQTNEADEAIYEIQLSKR